MMSEFRKGDIITLICGNGNRILVTHTTKSCYYLKPMCYPSCASCAYRKRAIDKNYIKVGFTMKVENEE